MTNMTTKKTLNIVILFLAVFLFGYVGQAQTLSSLHTQEGSREFYIDEGASLKSALEKLEKHYNVGLLYHTSIVEKVTIRQSAHLSLNIEEALSFLLKGTDLSFKSLNPKTYGIYKNALFNPQVLESEIQQTITGTVTDAQTGEALPGVNVVVVGSDESTGGIIGTTTDIDGFYELNVPDDLNTLTFSYVGYLSSRVEIDNRSVVNVELNPDVAGLEELVVVGYAVQRKINQTGSVSTIQSDKIVEVPSPNLGQTLTGKAPGVFTRQNQGVPGNDGVSLSIRGYNSPLVLVDGVETDNWNRIDPNEISSISILKDASAAVYGSRAGNGVILITTKRGIAREASRITYTTNTSFQAPTTLPQFVDSWQFAELLREGEFNQDLAYTYTEEEVQIFKEGNNPDYPNTNWHGLVLRDWAPMQTHNLGVSGGSEQLNYYISAGFLDQGSLYESKDLSFERYNFRSNIDAKITESLMASMDLAYMKEMRDQPQGSLGNIWTDLNLARPDFHATLPDPDRGAAYAGFNVRNPLAQTYQRYAGFVDDRRERFTGKIALRYEIPRLEGLIATARLNYSIHNTYDKTQDKPFEVLQYNDATQTYSSIGFNGQNKLTETSARYTEFFPMVQLNYDQSFGGDHTVGGLFVAEWLDTERNFYIAEKIDLLSLNLPYLFAGSSENVTANGFTTETGRASYVGRLNYSYKSKYLLEGTLRADATHKFREDNRWGYFPSISAGWRISAESFMDRFSGLDELKLRASYSQTGLDDVAAFQYLTGYEIRSGGGDFAINELFVIGSNTYRLIETTGLPNPNITWLEMTSYNVGLDGSFYGGLFGFEIDFFYRLVDNRFGQPLESFPSTFGATLPQLNINTTDDRGFEVLLTHRNIVSTDFFYSVEGSFSFGREKYVDWSEPNYEDPDEIRIFRNEGNFTNRRIGYLSDGIFMNQEEIDNHPIDQDQVDNSTLRPGDIKYIDLNGDGIIDWRDQDEIGYGAFPDIIFAMNLTAGYKGFRLSALLQGASMFDMHNQIHPFNNFSKPWDFHAKYRWQPDPNDKTVNINPNAKLPALLGDGVGRSPNNERTSDFWVADATYIRLKELTLSYTLPGNWINAVGFQNIQLSVSGTNLLTISNMGIFKNSIDPEAVSNEGRLYPPVKTLSMGLKLEI